MATSNRDEEDEDTLFDGPILEMPDPPLGKDPTDMDAMSYVVLDDLLHALIHDIVLKTHREEKISRANTAAMIVEDLAAATPPTSQYPHRAETDAAIYQEGVVFIKGNPLATTPEINCPQCRLPRLLYPIDGNGARPREEGKKYCTKYPFVSKANHDIYGTPFPKDDISSKSKKLQAAKGSNFLTIPNGSQPDNADSSFESPAPSPPGDTAEKAKAKQASFYPNVQCQFPGCSRSVSVRTFARHYQSHMKSGGRSAGRAAAMKINGQANGGSQNGETPPSSRKGTPALGSKPSPVKRSMAEIEDDDEGGDDDSGDDDESPKKKQKKKLKMTHLPHASTPGTHGKIMSAARTGMVKGMVKKWKSGRKTLDGKELGATQYSLPPPLPKAEKNREASESSQTLSSP